MLLIIALSHGLWVHQGYPGARLGALLKACVGNHLLHTSSHNQVATCFISSKQAAYMPIWVYRFEQKNSTAPHPSIFQMAVLGSVYSHTITNSWCSILGCCGGFVVRPLCWPEQQHASGSSELTWWPEGAAMAPFCASVWSQAAAAHRREHKPEHSFPYGGKV